MRYLPLLLSMLAGVGASGGALADPPAAPPLVAPPLEALPPPAAVPPPTPLAVPEQPTPAEPPPPPPPRMVAAVVPVLLDPPTGDPCGGAFAVRVGPVGEFYKMADVSMYGGGVDVAIGGGRCQRWDIFGDFRFVQGTTPGGLNVHSVSATVAGEWVLGYGLRFGFGGGFSDVGVQRVTTGQWAEGGGVKALLRFGYDTGLRFRPFVLVDVEGVLANTPSWGPALSAGIRL